MNDFNKFEKEFSKTCKNISSRHREGYYVIDKIQNNDGSFTELHLPAQKNNLPAIREDIKRFLEYCYNNSNSIAPQGQGRHIISKGLMRTFYYIHFVHQGISSRQRWGKNTKKFFTIPQNNWSPKIENTMSKIEGIYKVFSPEFFNKENKMKIGHRKYFSVPYVKLVLLYSLMYAIQKVRAEYVNKVSTDTNFLDRVLEESFDVFQKNKTIWFVTGVAPTDYPLLPKGILTINYSGSEVNILPMDPYGYFFVSENPIANPLFSLLVFHEGIRDNEVEVEEDPSGNSYTYANHPLANGKDKDGASDVRILHFKKANKPNSREHKYDLAQISFTQNLVYRDNAGIVVGDIWKNYIERITQVHIDNGDTIGIPD